MIKICGITTVEDALYCAEAGAQMLGFNIWADSPRSVSVAQAAAMAGAVREAVKNAPKIVIVDVSPKYEVLCGVADLVNPDFFQVHGRYSGFRSVASGTAAVPVIRAFQVAEEDDLDAVRNWTQEPFLIDAKVAGMHGGTGERVSPKIVSRISGRYLLAGGLSATNVAEAIAELRPYGVDAASGVEKSPGIKDREAVSRFVDAARAAYSA